MPEDAVILDRAVYDRPFLSVGIAWRFLFFSHRGVVHALHG
jgi:hypothetical protein